MDVHREAIGAGIDAGLIRALRSLRDFWVINLEGVRDEIRETIIAAFDQSPFLRRSQ